VAALQSGKGLRLHLRKREETGEGKIRREEERREEEGMEEGTRRQNTIDPG
jgi:hypothetical protein